MRERGSKPEYPEKTPDRFQWVPQELPKIIFNTHPQKKIRQQSRNKLTGELDPDFEACRVTLGVIKTGVYNIHLGLRLAIDG